LQQKGEKVPQTTYQLWTDPEGKRLVWLMGICVLVLLLSSAVRHALFQSNAFDLGIIDQAVYLISQGKTPFSSFLEFHILGDHASFIFYPIALLYWIYPNVHWLFVVQAVVLAVGAVPTWYLARQAGLTSSQSLAIGVAYLLYPLIFNINLFDFHPDIFAPAALLWAVLFARQNRPFWFCLALAVVLSCKEVFGLTVAAMGLWLWLERRRLYGAIALGAGIGWFILATQVVIPYFGGKAASLDRHIHRFDRLGDSFAEILRNFLVNPALLLGQLFNGKNLGYFLLLALPLGWGLHWQHLLPLIGAIPQLTINLLSNLGRMKNLVHQYSLPIMPFLLLATISSLSAGKGLFQQKRAIILWSLVAFMALAKYGYFGSRYLSQLDTWQAQRLAIAQVPPQTNLLTSSQMAPHLSHRPWIRGAWEAFVDFDWATLDQFETILLNARHPGFGSSEGFIERMLERLKNNPKFELRLQRDDVYLFTRKQ